MGSSDTIFCHGLRPITLTAIMCGWCLLPRKYSISVDETFADFWPPTSEPRPARTSVPWISPYGTFCSSLPITLPTPTWNPSRQPSRRSGMRCSLTLLCLVVRLSVTEFSLSLTIMEVKQNENTLFGLQFFLVYTIQLNILSVDVKINYYCNYCPNMIEQTLLKSLLHRTHIFQNSLVGMASICGRV